MKPRILSGIRATGRLHLGNYLGMVKGMLQLQEKNEHEVMFMVADLHAVTTPFKPEDLANNRRQVVIDYLAAGLDPEKSIVFLQADISEHGELAFYLSSVMNIARMQHLPTFKEKVKQYPHHATMALLNYPILMAADILLYKSGLVPVGLDQEPHLEIAREIARKFNEEYGMDFLEPIRFETPSPRVPSLTGVGKMSKSVEGSYLNLTDSLDEIYSKLKKVPTDGGRGKIESVVGANKMIEKKYISDDQESHGVMALMEFVELFMGLSARDEYEKEYQNTGVRYGDLKKALAEAIYKELQPIQERRKHFENNPEIVNKIIADGTAKAQTIARQTMSEVKTKMGFI